MNVRELMEKLSRLNPDLPVVMQQSDEPLGNYEVLDVEVVPGKPHSMYHASAPSPSGRVWDYPQVWDTYEGGDTEVVLLGSDKPWQPTIDGELVHRELT